MAGIYIHIPFCKRICSYCDFYKSTLVALIPEYLDAVCTELMIRSNYLEGETIDTLYIGGGTPSLLTPGQISGLIRQVSDHYPLSDHCEITIEANPDDLSFEFLDNLSKTAVNRLSIGVQSFRDEDLKILNRRHNALQAYECIQMARSAGFSNISIDLIYGIPGMELEDWIENISRIPGVEHISAYHLTLEPGTALSRQVSRGLLSLSDEDQSTNQFNLLHESAAKAGYIHYEISNLAREGFMSRHNSNYWKQERYLGAGPSAHSYDIDSRQWNLRDLKGYIHAVKGGKAYFEREELNSSDRYNEYVMLSLRTMWGIDERTLWVKFGESMHQHYLKHIQPYVQSGHVLYDGTTFKMNPAGWLISDYIVSSLMKL